MASEGQQAAAVLEAPTRTPEEQIKLNTEAQGARVSPIFAPRSVRLMPVISLARSEHASTRVGLALSQTPTKSSWEWRMAHPIGKWQPTARLQQMMNKTFDARDKDRALMQRGQTLNLIKNLLGGAAILFN